MSINIYIFLAWVLLGIGLVFFFTQQSYAADKSPLSPVADETSFTWSNGKHGTFTFKKDTNLTFHKNGNVKAGILLSNAPWTNGRNGTFTFTNRDVNGEAVALHFHPSGGVSEGTLMGMTPWTRGKQGRFIFANYWEYEGQKFPVPLYFHANGMVETGYLASHTTWKTKRYGNVDLNKSIAFYDNGQVRAANLSKHMTWKNDTNGVFTFHRDIRFYKSGKVMKGWLAHNCTWTNGSYGEFIFSNDNTWSFRAEDPASISFHANGMVHEAFLAKDAIWSDDTNTFTFHAGRMYRFYADGRWDKYPIDQSYND